MKKFLLLSIPMAFVPGFSPREVMYSRALLHPEPISFFAGEHGMLLSQGKAWTSNNPDLSSQTSHEGLVDCIGQRDINCHRSSLHCREGSISSADTFDSFLPSNLIRRIMQLQRCEQGQMKACKCSSVKVVA